jgi:hypothetical protein
MNASLARYRTLGRTNGGDPSSRVTRSTIVVYDDVPRGYKGVEVRNRRHRAWLRPIFVQVRMLACHSARGDPQKNRG